MARVKKNEFGQYVVTHKEEHFCQKVLEGCTLSDAYRSAYNPDNIQQSTIHEEASRIMKRVQVIARFDQLKNDRAERLQITGDSLLLHAKKIQHLAMEKEKYTDSLTANRLLMEKSGHFDAEGETDRKSLGLSADDHKLIDKLKKRIKDDD